MNRTQKGAVYGLILTGCLLFIPFFDFIESKIGLSMLVKHTLLIAWLIFLIGPVWLIERKKTIAPFDERDRQICIRAGIFAIVLSCLAAIIAYTISLFMFESSTLNMDNLAVVIYCGFILFILSLSLAVLFQYRRLK